MSVAAAVEDQADTTTGRSYFVAATGRVGPAETPLPEGAVALPRVGEFVVLPTPTGVVRGYWIGVATCALQPTFPEGRVRVRVLSGGEVVRQEMVASTLTADQVVSGEAEGVLAEAVAALASAYQMADLRRLEDEEWRRRLTEAAHEEADERDWCPEFDDFMEQVGLERRSRTYTCEVAVSTTVTVCVEATSAESAQRKMDRETVLPYVDLDQLELEVEEVHDD